MRRSYNTHDRRLFLAPKQQAALCTSASECFPACPCVSFVVNAFHPRCQQLIQNHHPFPQRSFQQQLCTGIQHIEDEIHHGHASHQLGADFLPPQPLLQRTERQCSPHTPLALTPRQPCPTQDFLLRQAPHHNRQFPK